MDKERKELIKKAQEEYGRFGSILPDTEREILKYYPNPLSKRGELIRYLASNARYIR